MEEIKERYVSKRVAELLKIAGFTEEVRAYYQYDSETKQWDFELDDREDTPSLWGDYYLSAPTQQMAMDYLRVEMGIEILLDVSYVNRTYNYTIVVWKPTGGDIIHSDEYYPKYGQCVDAALEYCLTNLLNYDTD